MDEKECNICKCKNDLLKCPLNMIVVINRYIILCRKCEHDFYDGIQKLIIEMKKSKRIEVL